MKKRPVISVQRDHVSAREAVLHHFWHAGTLYEVRLQDLDGSQFASICLAGTYSVRPLHPFPDELPAGLSAHAVIAGYIAAGEWLVKTGRWPDAETKAKYEHRSPNPAR